MRFGFVVLCTLLASACLGGGEEEKEAESIVTVVEVARAVTGDVSDLLLTTAFIESEAEANVAPGASGVVQEILVDAGDTVTEGQVLAIVKSTGLTATASRSSAELKRLERDAAVTRDLFEKGVVSERELRSIEHQLSQQVTTAGEASRNAGKLKIRAPFGGVVASRNIRVGEFASGAAFRIVDLDRLRVVASLPERDLGRVELNQRAELISVYDEEQSGRGVVSRIAPVVDIGSGTFRVTITVEGDQRTLRPGQYVTVKLEVDRHEGVVVIPKRAIVYEDGVPVVYRVIEGEVESEGEEPVIGLVAERAPISLGLVDDDVAEVTKGISVNDEVVVLGQNNLEEGAELRIVESTKADDDEDAG